MPLDQMWEASAMRETEVAMRELIAVGKNIGLKKVSLAMMLRDLADELDPPSILVPGSDAVQ